MSHLFGAIDLTYIIWPGSYWIVSGQPSGEYVHMQQGRVKSFRRDRGIICNT